VELLGGGERKGEKDCKYNYEEDDGKWDVRVLLEPTCMGLALASDGVCGCTLVGSCIEILERLWE